MNPFARRISRYFSVLEPTGPLSFRLWMEVEGKEEEKERGRENYFGSKLECLEGLVRVEYLRFDSSFRFLCRAEWRRMSLTMLTRGCFSFFFLGERWRDTLTRLDVAKKDRGRPDLLHARKTIRKEIFAMCLYDSIKLCVQYELYEQ